MGAAAGEVAVMIGRRDARAALTGRRDAMAALIGCRGGETHASSAAWSYGTDLNGTLHRSCHG